jgi:hypothetical protein
MTTITEFVSKYWLAILIVLYLVVTINKSTNKEHMTVHDEHSSGAPKHTDHQQTGNAVEYKGIELPADLQKHEGQYSFGPVHGTQSCFDECNHKTGHDKMYCKNQCSYTNCVNSCTGHECSGGIAFPITSYQINLNDPKNPEHSGFEKVSDSKCIYFKDTIDSKDQGKITNLYSQSIENNLDKNKKDKMIIDFAKQAYKKYGSLCNPFGNSLEPITLSNPENPKVADAIAYMNVIPNVSQGGGTSIQWATISQDMVGRKLPDGNDLNTVPYQGTHHKTPLSVNNVFECQHICDENGDCRAWTYDMNSGKCHLKDDKIKNTSHHPISKMKWRQQKLIKPKTDLSSHHISGFKPYFIAVPE